MKFLALTVASALVLCFVSSVRGDIFDFDDDNYGGYGYGGIGQAVYHPYAAQSSVYPSYVPGLYHQKGSGGNAFEMLIFFLILLTIFGSINPTTDKDGKKHHGWLFG